MGLDTVELIMAIEEHFGIGIPNEDAAKLSKVGDIHEYVVAALKRQGHSPDDTQVFEEVRRLIAEQGGIDPQYILPEMDIVKDLGMD